MGRWYNVNDLGCTSESVERGRLDLQRAVVGDDAVAVIQNTVNTLHDLYFHAIGQRRTVIGDPLSVVNLHGTPYCWRRGG